MEKKKIKKRIEENYVIKDIYFEDNGKNFHYFEKVKLSTLEQIKALAESCGFEVVKIWEITISRILIEKHHLDVFFSLKIQKLNN